jgi:hypothetical protein
VLHSWSGRVTKCWQCAAHVSFARSATQVGEGRLPEQELPIIGAALSPSESLPCAGSALSFDKIDKRLCLLFDPKRTLSLISGGTALNNYRCRKVTTI